jgi:predicted PurR-regulated permease PerM
MPAPGVRRRWVFLVVSAAIFLGILIAAREVLLPFVLALVVAYVFTPIVSQLERRRVPRWVAIIGTYLVTLGTIYGFIAVIAPRIVHEAATLRHEAPSIIRALHETWGPRIEEQTKRFDLSTENEPGHDGDRPQPSGIRISPRPDGAYDVDLGPGIAVRPIGDGAFRIDEIDSSAAEPLDAGRMWRRTIAQGMGYARTNALALIKVGRAIVAAVSRAIFVFFLTLMLGAYIMLTRERIFDFFRSFVRPDARLDFDDLLVRIDRGLSGVVRGQLLICLVNGALSAVGFWLFGIKYWPLLALVAGAMSLLPIFGSILSSVPVVLIALTQSTGQAVAVLAWIIGIHQVEANFLNPKIIGDAAKIHPVLVVFSLVVGEHLFQLPGALLAVPTLSILQSIFLHFRHIVYEDELPPDSVSARRSLPPVDETPDAGEVPR